jgi:glycosyltransferase involved in cell wall biosynthesis
MKVLVLSHMYPSIANEIYGIFVHEQVKALIAKGVEVRVVSPVPWSPFPVNQTTGKWQAYSRIPQSCTWDGVEVFYPRYVVFPRAWFFATSGQRMYRGIRKVVEKIYHEFPFDLIHAHVALPDGYAGALLAKDFSKPLVITIHGQDLLQTVHRGTSFREAIAFALQHASRVIVVSKKLLRLAVEHFGILDKLVVVPNGINLQKIAMVKDSVNHLNVGNVILSVSNLIKRKGIDLNIRAIGLLRRSKYSKLQYLIVGSGPEERRLRALVTQLGLEKWVTFAGRQPHINVLRHMSGCTVFSLPSWNEAFGVVYVEAMALGKPVIGCQGEGPEDFVEHGKTGLLVKPRDVDSLVEALDFLLSHPDEARAMGERAREVVLANYTWEKSAEKVMEVYREVLGM